MKIDSRFRICARVAGFAAALLIALSSHAQHFTTYDLIVPTSATSTTITVDGAGRIMPTNRSFVIGIAGGQRGPLLFTNWTGTPEYPVVIVNQHGTGRVTVTDVVPGSTTYTRKDGIVLDTCKYFQLRGDNDPAYRYGIEIAQVGNKAQHTKVGINVGGASTDGEISFLEVHDSGFVGIMVKSDPSEENPATWAANFVMRNIRIRDTYIRDVGGEGMYLGYTSWHTTYTTTENPPINYQGHEIHGLRVHHNLVERAGWETVQVASNPVDTKLHDNVLYWGGVSPRLAPFFQGSNLAIGGGATGEYFNNTIIKAYYNCISITGQESRVSVYNNLLLDAGEYGIFSKNQPEDVPSDPDVRQTIAGSFLNIFNNTIVNPTLGGYYTQDEITVNNFKNNVLVVPDPAPYIKIVSTEVVNDQGNIFRRDASALGFANIAESDYRITSGSDAVNAGVALDTLPPPEISVIDDHQGVTRPQDGVFDAGYSERGGLSLLLVATPPPSGGGTGSVKASVMGGTPPYTYAWSNGSSTATLSGVAAGLYSVLVTDAGGASVRKGVYLQPGATYGAPVSDVPAANQVLPVTLSPAPGTYNGPQTVTLSSPTPGDTLRYTTDGSLPTSGRGATYGGPITLGGTTVLKVIAYKTGMLPSSIVTATYVIENGPVNTKFTVTDAHITESSHKGANAKGRSVDGNLGTMWQSATPLVFSPAGAWVPVSTAGAFNNSHHSTTQTDATFEFNLSNGNTPTQFHWYGEKGPAHGIVAIQVDDENEVLIDTYAATLAQDQLIYSNTALGTGGHRIRVRVTGTKNPASTGFKIVADRFIGGSATIDDAQEFQWIRYDLGANKRVSNLKIAFNDGARNTFRFEIHTSTDDVNYTPLVSNRVPQHPNWFINNRDNLLQDFDLPDLEPVRYVRIVGRGNINGNYSLRPNNSFAEVEIWGGDVGSAQPRGVYQAEAATLAGALVKTYQTGYTGSGFVQFVNASGDYVEWTVNNPVASTRGLTFRYQHGGSPKTVSIAVNGATVAPALAFNGTGAPGVWINRAIATTLPAGAVTIRMTTTGTGGPNVDALHID